MTEVVITWPLDLRPTQQSFYIRTNTISFQSPLTGQTQVQERDGARWVANISLSRNQTDTRRIEAFLAALKGPVGIILLPDFRRLSAKGSLAGLPYLASGSGTNLTITNFMPNAENVLRAGDLIQTSTGRVHMVLQNINANGSGAAVVPIAPRLREAITVGALITNNARARMRLLSDDAARNQTDKQLLSRFELELIEALPET